MELVLSVMLGLLGLVLLTLAFMSDNPRGHQPRSNPKPYPPPKRRR